MASKQATAGLAVRTGMKAARHGWLAIVPVAALLLGACEGSVSPTEPTLPTVQTASSSGSVPAGDADSQCPATTQWTDRSSSAAAMPAPTAPPCQRPRPGHRQVKPESP